MHEAVNRNLCGRIIYIMGVTVIMLQHEIYCSMIEKLKKDHTNHGILLTGSVASKFATEYSDLDIVVLSEKPRFESMKIDNVAVEILYIMYESEIEKIRTTPMTVYRYLNAKIGYDNGQLREIINFAKNTYENYSIPDKESATICYWLNTTKSKIKSAIAQNDELLESFLISTNIWKLLEGIWAVNKKPMPPSSTVYRNYCYLKQTPYEEWFSEMFSENINIRTTAMLTNIDWVLSNLNTVK